MVKKLIDINEMLWKEAKKKAIDDDISVNIVVENGLKKELRCDKQNE